MLSTKCLRRPKGKNMKLVLCEKYTSGIFPVGYNIKEEKNKIPSGKKRNWWRKVVITGNTLCPKLK